MNAKSISFTFNMQKNVVVKSRKRNTFYKYLSSDLRRVPCFFLFRWINSTFICTKFTTVNLPLHPREKAHANILDVLIFYAMPLALLNEYCVRCYHIYQFCEFRPVYDEHILNLGWKKCRFHVASHKRC